MPQETSELKDLLAEQIQDLLSAENQLVAALPKMSAAAHEPKLKEAFDKHLQQTKGHAERATKALRLLGESAQSKPCKGMQGVIAEAEEVIEEGEEHEDLIADIGLIAAAQRAEHYEIAGYGSARCLAKLIGQQEIAKLLSHTLGEEEGADFLLTSISEPLLQQAVSVEYGDGTRMPWGEPGETPSQGKFLEPTKARVASATQSSKLKLKTKSKKGQGSHVSPRERTDVQS